MMKICGIVAEYNPFHNGHALLARKIRAELAPDFIVAVMSGDFVQRGEPAVCDKWQRTRAALENGVDLVAELPSYFALSGASHFAGAAVKILRLIGAGFIAFGAENADIEALEAAAAKVEDKTALNAALRQGKPYASAYAAAFGDDGLLKTPNNLLAVEYIRAIAAQQAAIVPFAFKRGVAHDTVEAVGGVTSASNIRRMIYAGDEGAYRFMPDGAGRFAAPDPQSPFFPCALRYIAASQGSRPFLEAAGANEGLGERIYRSALGAGTVGEIAEAAKSKRFSASRVRRTIFSTIITHSFHKFNIFSQNGYTNFIRVLGFRKSAEALVAKLCGNADAPVIVNLKKDEKKLRPPWDDLLDADIRASRVYGAYAGGGDISEYARPTIIV